MDHLYDSAQLEQASALPTPPEDGPPPLPRPAPEDDDVVTSFPKEFNRRFWETMDRRFMAILILVMIIEPLIIIYELWTHPPGTTEAEVARLQAKYAETFLSEFEVEPPRVNTTPNELLLYASEYLPAIVEEVMGTEPPTLNPGLRPGAGTPEARGVTREASEIHRRISSAVRERARQALSEEVGRVGLLGLLTSTSNLAAPTGRLVSYQPVQDVLEHGVAQAQDLEQVLSQVRTLRVPRVGQDYFGAPVGGASGGLLGHGGFDAEKVMIAQREVRGERHTASGVQAEEIVTNLAAAPKKEVTATREFQKVEPVESLVEEAVIPGVTGLARRRPRETASRDPARMREIVMSHSAAIQDCYRQALKTSPTLKGEVSVRFTVAYTGRVTEASVISSTLNLPDLDKCILRKILRWNDFGRMDPSTPDVTLRQTYKFGY
ncbi:MAG: AgmX/PglI C-terminal domain-containing protein [candidate division KSB1 bacterium]|nr:AgmX/PglI C-terminal domain-containing protein [candidate division KSB1 bacterium]MDZ7273853.1 AgmX/PglI C-terminal domain-containing protein [candidate division KSB1 bacterium]MDZ7286009.1 AgmX/PglI C-terminal domain-containing protein [candidate division KSB1 bacterium]MDZ7299041.1 AgmX/PglI C-terminal domain-containing protein [candidate division KSB1 bacterium]MDZ7307988.1 AgmX/PglI C-terminal domain-containing protein [candidate division KSB1 bacterium]